MITPFLSDGMGRRPISFLPDDNGYFKPLVAIRKLWKCSKTTFDDVAAHGEMLAFHGESTDNRTKFSPGGWMRHGHGGPM
jgi:hypothetical protein